MKRRAAGTLCSLALVWGCGTGLASGDPDASEKAELDCQVNADCDDGDVCTFDRCSAGTCEHEPNIYGDVDFNGLLSVFDVFCILDGIAGEFEGNCTRQRLDIHPCHADGMLNVFDVLALLKAISGLDRCCTPMVRIPAGQFLMGDHHDEGDSDERPVHAVNLDAFYMGMYEVTNRQYADALNWAYGQGLLDDPNIHGGVVRASDGGVEYCDTAANCRCARITWDGSTFGVLPGKQEHPMVMLSWYGAAAYTNWRSAQEGRTPSYDLTSWGCNFDANGYRLPTEAEWEYAARGGQHDPYYRRPWGDNLDGSKANYWGSGDPFDNGTAPVGYYDGNQTPPGSDMANGYGLYDMNGNVWEWCNDWYDPAYYGSSPADNPRGPASGTKRVLRGGGWESSAAFLRCAARVSFTPDYRHGGSGFGIRLVLDLE